MKIKHPMHLCHPVSETDLIGNSTQQMTPPQMYCNQCNTLQHTATTATDTTNDTSTAKFIQCVVTRFSVLQRVAASFGVLQSVVACFSVLQRAAACFPRHVHTKNMSKHTATHCNHTATPKDADELYFITHIPLK